MKNILVTGSSSGFGFLIAETLARAGYRVYAGMRDTTGRNAQAKMKLEAVTSGLQLAVLDLDVTLESSVAAAVTAVPDGVDVLVNNAGYTARGPLEGFSAEQTRAIFETNVIAPLCLNRAVLPAMRARGEGLIVQISSTVAHLNYPFIGLYGATKAALEALSESQFFELAPLGVDVVMLEPGSFPTGVSSKAVLAEIPEAYQPLLERFQTAYGAVQRAAAQNNPQDVADAVLKLVQTERGTRPRRVIVANPDEAAPIRRITEVIEGLHNQMVRAALG